MHYRTALQRKPIITIGLTWLSYLLLMAGTAELAVQSWKGADLASEILFWTFGVWGIFSTFQIAIFLIKASR
ncbi:MAG: hypothetical protein COB40_03065 [Marinosulfonomonas sp.]|nr:MAG: hypothetical protein COB40_03065 [Marinosulfonomonas sp.]